MAKHDKVDFSRILRDGWREMTIPGPSRLPEDKLPQLEKYFVELEKWCLKINLVAKAEAAQIIENHFLDSLTLLPLLEPYKKEGAPTLLDIGSGAGFPGLVIKIVCPWLRVILVEPRQKRVSFLRHIIRSLHLDNIDLREERLVEDKAQFQENYGQPDIITSRAVADIKTTLKMLSASPAKSKIICMKGPKAEAEIEEWRKTAASPFTLIGHQRFTLPVSGAARALIVFAKKGE
jgi:16S rRNA (guanine527-N7)-methyltransferase